MSNVLKALKREKVGSRTARKERASGRIPVTLSMDKQELPLNLTIDEHEFMNARRRHEHVYELEFDGQTEMALVTELQWDVFGEHLNHVEFRRVIKGQKTEAEVEIAFVGMPKGGLLNHLVTHVTIRAIPSLIPESLEVDVDGLEPGAAIHASDLKLPEDVELEIEADTLIANIQAPRGEEEAAPAEGEAAAEGEAEGGETPDEGEAPTASE